VTEQRVVNPQLKISKEALEANESIQKFEEKYRIAYKSIMELIITNFENKNNAEAK
jgi:hypothetical protein